MGRLYIIIITIFSVLMFWVLDSNARLLPIKGNSKVTDGMVNDKLQDYLECINTELIILMGMDIVPMKEQTASANTLKVVQGCDGHLRGVMKWLINMGEPTHTIRPWANRMRQEFLDKVFLFLTTGISADDQRDRDRKDERSHRNQY